MSDLHIKNVLMHKYDNTREYQKRLSGRKMSDDNAINFLSVRPLYFVKTLESFQKPLQDLETPIYDALKIVEAEYSRSRILLNEWGNKMAIAANFLKQARLFTPVSGEGRQLNINLASATSTSGNINIPNVPDINVGRLAPNAPTTPSTTEIRARRDQRTSVATQRFSPTGLPQTSKVDASEIGKQLGKALFANKGTPVTKTNPFGFSDPNEKFSFKEGGFITKK